MDSLKYGEAPEHEPSNRSRHGVRLIFENSTVCHSRRISLLCPVSLQLVFWVVGDGFFGKTMILTFLSVLFFAWI